MRICFMLTKNPLSISFLDATNHLKRLLEDNNVLIEQVFFYSEAVLIATMESYPKEVEAFIDMCFEHEINLYVCSAAFERRKYHLSSLGQEDFEFMGLGQFVGRSCDMDAIYVY